MPHVEPISPSVLYCHAAGVAPTGSRALRAGAVCAMCASRSREGDIGTSAKGLFSESFNNKLDLVEGAAQVCGFCNALWCSDWLQKYSKSYACKEGVFKLTSNPDQAKFVWSPPEPPFVAILSTKKQQHLIWRTPVNYSRDLIFIRLDDEVLKIRCTFLLTEGLPAWMSLCAMMKEQSMKGLPAALDRDLSKFETGVVRPDVAARAKAMGLGQAVATLAQLSSGEWWGLSAVRQFSVEELDAMSPFLLANATGARFEIPKKDA